MTTTELVSTEPVLTLPPLPQLSLAPAVEGWCTHYLRQPDGPDAGGPWRFTREQRRFLWCWYAIDERGRFLWSRGVKRRSKGWGKSPEAGALCCVELCGPVRFGGWDENGEPIAVPVTPSAAWVQIAGVSEKQTENTLSVVRAMLDGSPAVAEYGLDIGLTRIYSMAGGKIEPITAAAATAEGARPTFVVGDEPHHWLEANGGHKLAEVLRRNLAKIRDGTARMLETTNAHEMGKDSVAERSYKAYEAQKAMTRQTILYDSREAPAVDLTDEAALREALKAAYGDAAWVDLDRLVDEIYDPQNPESESRRFYLNQLAVSEDAWTTPTAWDALGDKSLRVGDRPVLAEDEMVALGFDGSLSDDHSGLFATRISDGTSFRLGWWDPARYDGEAPRELIDAEVQAARERYDVVAFFSDVHPFESYVDKWAVDFGERRGNGSKAKSTLCAKASATHAVAFDMRSRQKEFTQLGVERLAAEIREQAFVHDADPVTAQHVYNARRRPNAWGVSFAKEHRESANKVDLLAALVLSRMARRAYLALPPSRQRRQRSGRASF